MGPEQLALYARELGELYRREQKLRQELEAKNQELEQRVRELQALNNMFQQHLDIRMRTEEAFQQLVAGLRRMVEEADELLRQSHGQGPQARDK